MNSHLTRELLLEIKGKSAIRKFHNPILGVLTIRMEVIQSEFGKKDKYSLLAAIQGH